MNETLPPFYRDQRQRINSTLDQLLPPLDDSPKQLHEAMRYSTLNGGKRLRGVITLECERLSESIAEEAFEIAAASIEMIHAYTLVHDDLPAMDDDKFRRGQPACHRKFGENLAILCGDSLLTYSFETLSGELKHYADDDTLRECMLETAQLSGSKRLIGGQATEFELDDSSDTEDILEVYENKTGSLIELSFSLGGILAGFSDSEQNTFKTAGRKLGISFQIQDDLLEDEGNFEEIGKDLDSDERQKHQTLPQKIGKKPARELANDKITEAIETLSKMNYDMDRIKSIAEFFVQRSY